MIEKMSNYIVDNFFLKNENPDDDQREILLFGVTRIIEDTPKYVLIFLMSWALNILNDVGIVLLITALYKTLVGGAHANSNISCFLFSTTFFITPSIIAKFIELSDIKILFAMLIVDIFSIYCIWKYVPADTQEVPVLNKNKRSMMQILSIISLILINMAIIFFIKNNNVKEIILITMIYINFMSTNIAYKLLKCTRSKDSEEFKDLF